MFISILLYTSVLLPHYQCSSSKNNILPWTVRQQSHILPTFSGKGVQKWQFLKCFALFSGNIIILVHFANSSCNTLQQRMFQATFRQIFRNIFSSFAFLRYVDNVSDNFKTILAIFSGNLTTVRWQCF